MLKLTKLLGTLGLLLAAALPAQADDVKPTAAPTATITYPDDKAGELGNDDYEAPLTVRFESNTQANGWTPYYEWRITRVGDTQPFLVRNDADLEYTFLEHAQWEIDFYVSFVQGGDTIVYDREPEKPSDTSHITRMGALLDSPFTLSISDSQLEFPNAFSPNGDHINDYLNAKQANVRGIVEFEASVFTRSGRKIYSWNQPKPLEAGWDGTDHGRRVPDGAYYLVVKAKGADGHKYNIRKVISVLTGFREDGESANP
ncbi:MAG: gliding motility-associated C-terminal domain-containing protein [Bacteroidaceae bacterium]|nr:gliding motility-associated C-terminal domain-containing protein [Bacteroidaceae bacterium]